jgi:hypothetical protein
MVGVDSGNAAPLVGGPPGVELHTVLDGLPIGDTGDVVPVPLPTAEKEMVPMGFDDIAIVVVVIAAVPLVGAEAAMDGTLIEG